MRIELKKQAEKYLKKCGAYEKARLINALIALENLNGDIKKMEGRKNEYRVKIPPFRIIFIYDKINKIVTVTKIETRENVYKKR